MKTYKGNNSNNTEAPDDLKKKKIIYSVLIGISLIIIALAITLSVVFSNLGKVPAGNDILPDDPAPPVDVKPEEPVYYLPVEGGVIREAALDKLVYMPSLNMWKSHNGVDFSATEGASVLAMTDGTVTSAQETTLEGWVITISHSNGLVSVYKSLASASVKTGETVKGGSVIGKAGTMMTESSDGVHVHMELLRNGKYIDPLSYVDADIIK